MDLYLFSNHNYFNRKIKKLETVDEYITWLKEIPAIFPSINFNPNDGVSTKQIINFDMTSDFAERNISMSYCIAATGNEIISRWWILDCRRIRNGQVELSLLRDVVTDYKEIVSTCPAFINKGWIKSTSDSAIYNNENMTFNQIKTSEKMLKDKSGTAWYVAYISKDLADKTITIPAKDVNTTDIYSTWEEYPYYQYTISNPFVADYTDVAFQLYGYENAPSTIGIVNFCTSWNENGQPSNLKPDGYLSSLLGTSLGDGISVKGGQKGYRIDNRSKLTENFTAAATIEWKPGSYALTGAHSETATNTFLEEDGRFIKVGEKSYKVKVVLIDTSTPTTVEIPNTNVYADKFKNVAAASGAYSTSIIGNISSLVYTAPRYYMTYEEVEEEGFTFTIPANRQHTKGCPYDLLAIPAQFCYLDDGDSWHINNESLAESVITAINSDLADNEIFDIQLLPYAPLNDEFIENRVIRATRMPNTENTINTSLLSSGNLKTMIVYPESAEHTKRLSDHTITLPTNAKEFKISNECDMYRLCSPNYNGQFEFSAAKNGGVNGWNIAFTYKPYIPYIRVAPMFNRLYGRDFEDARGLILGGDFSISQINDAWKSYELNNKNYQVMFDRQIQNMEVNNSVSRTMDIVNSITGTAQGAVSGGVMGSMAGGPMGAVVGAVAGGVASAAGGIADIALNEKLRKEQMQFTRDQFGYQLQNIKALPYSLTKVGSQNADYKLFPFVEFYTCTDVERQALSDKIDWESMSIGRIGSIDNFTKNFSNDIGTFIQARPIRIEIQEDSRVVDFITQELQTGVYIL